MHENANAEFYVPSRNHNLSLVSQRLTEHSLHGLAVRAFESRADVWIMSKCMPVLKGHALHVYYYFEASRIASQQLLNNFKHGDKTLKGNKSEFIA